VLEAPPLNTYTSCEQGLQALYNWSQEQGYGLTIEGTNQTKKKAIKRYRLRCDKGGKKRGEGLIRKTGSRMEKCPFKVILRRIQATHLWVVEVVAGHGTHNHEASDHPSEHPCHRRMTAQEVETVKELTRSNAAPRTIVSKLHQEDHQTLVTRQDVYNAQAKLRREGVGEYTPIETLVKELEDSDEWALYYSTAENTGHVNQFFFAYAPAIDLAQSYPDVILADATYRTNRYNMPLLHFIGVTCLGTSFSIAWCFMGGETAIQYASACRKFRELVMGQTKISVILTDDETALKEGLAIAFPHVPQLLCVWHVEQNVLGEAQKVWKVSGGDDQGNTANSEARSNFMDRWTGVVYAKSEDEFEEKYSKLKQDYANQPALMVYLDNHKYPKRREFAQPWTSKVTHLGNT